MYCVIICFFIVSSIALFVIFIVLKILNEELLHGKKKIEAGYKKLQEYDKWYFHLFFESRFKTGRSELMNGEERYEKWYRIKKNLSYMFFILSIFIVLLIVLFIILLLK